MTASAPRVAGTGENFDLPKAAILVLALAAWLAAHPFWGIIHDNRLYAVQALRHNDPAILSGDLFFKYGSQDSFTIFSPIYGTLIRFLGLDLSTILLTAMGQGMWLAGAISLIRAVVPRPFTPLALLLLVTYPANYGGFEVFSIGEGFVTPRLFSEALAMASLAAYLGNRFWLASILLITGTLLHPLMMVAPAAVIVLMSVCRGRPWWAPVAMIGGGTVLVIAALAFVRVAGLPFPATIDPEWKWITGARSQHLFLGKWMLSDWSSVSSDMIVVLLAASVLTPPMRQLFVTIAAVAAASLAVSFVGFDLLDSLPVGQAQVWRAIWLLRVLAPIALALLICDACQRSSEQQKMLWVICAVLAILASLSRASGLTSLHLPAVILVSIMFLTDRWKQNDPAFLRLVSWTVAAALALVTVIAMVKFFPLFSHRLSSQDPLLAGLTPVDIVLIFLPTLLLALGLFLFFTGPRERNWPWILVSIATLCFAAANWDRRDAWRRYMDSAPDIGAELRTPVAPGENVYWPGNVMGPWTALGRQNFYSNMQGAGAIFNRETAVEFIRRFRIVSRFEPAADWQSRSLAYAMPSEDGLALSDRPAGLADLQAVCGQAIRPDVIVLSQKVAGASHETWRAAVGQPYMAPVDRPDGSRVFELRFAHDFFIYRCKDVMNDPQITQ